jgi:tetratricopeptide (TPR) repeat protein
MPDTHLWITGADRAARAEAAAAYSPDASADCHRRRRGPYTGAGSLLRALVPQVQARLPGLAARHGIEILAVAPELASLIGPAPETLTSLAPAEERTRWYSRYRTRRIAHGLVDFLRAAAADGPVTLALGSADQADRTDQEFIAIALRRLDPAQVRLLVSSGQEIPELDTALAAYCQRRVIEHSGRDGGADEISPDRKVAAFIASDGTSDLPGERAAYLDADPQLRARLHDERAAELESRGEWSLRLGAIPYHLERGSLPGTRAREAYQSAANYCLGMAYYDACMDLARRLARFIDPDTEPKVHYLVHAEICQCLALLERPAETEPIYYDLLSRSPDPFRHMNVSYALGILYTRLYPPDHKDHYRARAHLNTAIAIASQFETPEKRAFHTVFMNNGKALVETHLGNVEEALRLVSDGIARLDRELAPEQHRLHRSVLHHNRAQTLAALGRLDEAVTDFGHVIEVDPNYPEYRFDRGNLLYKMGRHAEALADYEAAGRLTPPFPELFHNRADVRAAIGDVEGAISDWRYVLDLEPDYLEARVSLASLLLDAGNPQAAAAQVRAGLAVTPGEARLHCTLGLALLDLADPEAARQAFDRALDLDPGLTEALVNRAIAAYEQGQYDDAVADLATALASDARNPDLLYNRGLAYEAAGRPEDAITDYTTALQDSRADRATLLYQRGRCHAALTRFAEARNDLEAHLALGDSPYEQEIRDLLGTCMQGTLTTEPAHPVTEPAEGPVPAANSAP